MEETPPFRYEGQLVNNKFIASVSNVLDLSGIASVLWGTLVLHAYGASYALTTYELVIPDEDIDRAYEVLHERGFHACLKGPNCCYSTEWKGHKPFPIGARHLHFAASGEEPLQLHKKSRTLWAVPTFEPSSIKKDPSAKIILASDRDGLPEPDGYKGAFSEDLFPTRIPSAHCYLEALALLIERYWNEEDDTGTFASSWMYWFTTYLLHLDERFKLEYTDPRCRVLYNALRVDQRKFDFRETLLRMRRLTREIEQGA